MTSIFLGSVPTPCSFILCPRNITSFWNNIHFFGLSFKLAFLNLSKIISSLSNWAENEGEGQIISSKYIMTIDHNNPLKTICINLVNVAGALHKPKANFFHCHWDPPGIEKAVLWRFFLFILTWLFQGKLRDVLTNESARGLKKHLWSYLNLKKYNIFIHGVKKLYTYPAYTFT